MKLYKGDCLEVMKTIQDKSIDAIITDPPYGTTACKWDSVIDFKLMWTQLNRIIKPNSPINTETNFILEIFSSLKNRNTQKTVNKGMVDINILCNPDDIFFKAYMKVHPGINIAKNPVRQP